MSVGRPSAFTVAPSFRVKVATPSEKVIPPYVPLIVVSLSVTVNVNLTSLSAAASDTSTLDSSRSPVSRVFVNSALDGVVLIVPVSPVLPVCWNPVAAASVIVYVTPVGRPVAVCRPVAGDGAAGAEGEGGEGREEQEEAFHGLRVDLYKDKDYLGGRLV